MTSEEKAEITKEIAEFAALAEELDIFQKRLVDAFVKGLTISNNLKSQERITA